MAKSVYVTSLTSSPAQAAREIFTKYGYTKSDWGFPGPQTPGGKVLEEWKNETSSFILVEIGGGVRIYIPVIEAPVGYNAELSRELGELIIKVGG